MADRAKRGQASAQQVFDYYLNWLTTPSITDHYQLPVSEPAYARDWGMRVAVEDLRRVIDQARAQSREVVLGGHSLGASIATAYATWDFGGRAGGEDLEGSCWSTAAVARRPSPPRTRRWPCRPCRPVRRGSCSAAFPLRLPACSTSWER